MFQNILKNKENRKIKLENQGSCAEELSAMKRHLLFVNRYAMISYNLVQYIMADKCYIFHQIKNCVTGGR